MTDAAISRIINSNGRTKKFMYMPAGHLVHVEVPCIHNSVQNAARSKRQASFASTFLRAVLAASSALSGYR